MRPDSSDLDAAVVNVLQADATLHGLMPDGVFFDSAPPGLKRFVLVDLFDSFDRTTYAGRRVFEAPLYAVRAVGLSSTSPNMKGAAKRIDELLGDAVLTVPGYGDVHSFKADDAPRIRHDEPNETDATIVFKNRGAHYRLHAAIPDNATR